MKERILSILVITGISEPRILPGADFQTIFVGQINSLELIKYTNTLENF